MPILTFDIETYVDPKRKGQFLFGGVYNGTDYMHFSDRIKMKKFMTGQRFRNCTWYAHNLEYDLNRIFLYDKQLERYYLGSRLILAKYPVGDKMIYFNDSFNLSFSSLTSIGSILGYSKKDIEFQNRITSKYVEYNQRDCEITYRYLIRLQNIISLLGGNLKTTLASTSMDIFRRKFLDPAHSYYKLKPDVLKLFRKAYYGGRAEVFNFNKVKRGYYYDINSCYPNAMLGGFPLLNTYKSGVNLEKDGFTLCEISYPDTYYPVMPYRGDSKLLFPIGKWSGYFFNNEIQSVAKLAPRVKINPISGWHYKKSAYIFSKYILSLYKKRMACDNKVEDFVYKILMNSLYGKFASRNFLEQFVGNKRTMIKTIPVSTNVIWSGMVTAYARENLNRLLLQSQGIYCDTDSSVSLQEIPCNKNIGDVGLKGIFRDFQAFNPKHYQYKDGKILHTKIKGIPKRAIASMSNTQYTYEIPVKFKTAIRRNLPITAWETITKRLNMNYDKRIKMSDGDTRPLRVYYDEVRG